jgi:hypothetical protein
MSNGGNMFSGEVTPKLNPFLKSMAIIYTSSDTRNILRKLTVRVEAQTLMRSTAGISTQTLGSLVH